MTAGLELNRQLLHGDASGAVTQVLSALGGCGCEPRRSGRSWSARCSAHEDRRPSLSIGVGDDGRVLLHCHAGCAVEDVVAALGLTMRDLMSGAAARSYEIPHQRPESRISYERRKRRRSSPLFTSARAAIEHLERGLGPRSAAWTYHDVDYQPVGVVVRWDSRAGKRIMPVSRYEDGWRVAGMPVPRPLYRLPELIDAARVFVCEGEKAAEAARSIGVTATTSAHGSGSPHHTDWSPLAGKEIILLPDNDAAGEKYARRVAQLLHRLSQPPTVKIVRLPGLPPGGDIADLVDTKEVVL